ncbi:putative Golgi/lysosome glycoprotein [Leptomonas pyrrhocoris]|uniref:Putative Golgi/lysosome glycoprotein n=1 Tax=Leptomonas pyrrhocoris TaxID=157538 RepID=A0A0M9FP97_LEPPY|nr:putative Golgi/lysosome glycoprotein [Leptomonas pyrrhocoris]KPA73227.1 putative Golgi/lysosome glycoprotein [Leptomonas pyrrhocoris]|eukprot:XP_015651666.1 putative Golgi/lysosome glycoprotein [Leptomonas pyrrhocoris]
MTQVPRVVVVVAAVLAAVLLCLQGEVAAAGENKKLYPACGGIEHTATANSQEEVTLYSHPYSYNGIALDCLAYEVTSLKGGQKNQKKDYCVIKHQTEYAYSIVLRATYVDDSGDRVTRDFSIRDMTGGSLTSVTTRMPQSSKYSLVFKNLATNKRCNLQVRALVSLSTVPDADASAVGPTVVAIEPRTVYTKDSPRTYLVLDHGHGVMPSRSDVVTLVDYTLGTCAQPVGDVVTMDYSSSIPPSVHITGDESDYSARVATLYNPNTYRVCYRGADSSSALEIAVITAFSGNPAYYEVISGEDSEGRVLVGEKATIKFYGYDLDSRQHGDEAKFVWFTDECDWGAPAAGVPLTDDLGPDDNYGPNTTYTLWTWTMKEEGAFKVCYKRKATGKWTEVPSIDDIGPGAAADTSTPSPVPDPTDPSTKEKCPKLTYNSQDPWKKYKSVQVTLATKDIPDTFFHTLSQVLCLPVNMFIVMHSRKTDDGYKNVFLTLNCDAAGNEGQCDMTERLNYFAQLSTTVLNDHGITAVVGSTSVFAFDDDKVVTIIKRSSNALIFCGLCVLAGGGMAVFAVNRYQERRHHFTQFGLDEDDIDDMYDFGTAPGPGAPGTTAQDHYSVPGAPQQPPARIRNAVIEIED